MDRFYTHRYCEARRRRRRPVELARRRRDTDLTIAQTEFTDLDSYSITSSEAYITHDLRTRLEARHLPRYSLQQRARQV